MDTLSQPTSRPRDSQTAGFTCLARACASRERDPRRRGPDDLANVFLPTWVRLVLAVPGLRRLFVRKLFPVGMYEYVFARTKFLDRVFDQALENAIPQIVLLGAGFDTRALRFQKRNKGTRIWELDLPATQNPKIEIYTRKHVTLPGELSLVPIDFSRDRLDFVLAGAGYQPRLRTLFIWEGVTMYLDAAAVDRTLETIHRLTIPGSLLAFDYIGASVVRRENRYDGEQQVFDAVAKAGERWTFGIEAGQIEQFLADRGFDLVSNLTADDLTRQYLTAEDGSCLGQVSGTHSIVLASTR
jgi:methyltransferase (TIGR00027 family)